MNMKDILFNPKFIVSSGLVQYSMRLLVSPHTYKELPKYARASQPNVSCVMRHNGNSLAADKNCPFM